MKKDVVRKQMVELWKNTFHDSDDYVNMIFNSYFDMDLVAYHEVGGKVVAALLGVPYNFAANDATDSEYVKHNGIVDENDSECCGENHKGSVRGLYLCGLATLPEFRKGGIMSRLMQEINIKAGRRGFAFTFLIPASEGLRKYYKDRGYVDSFYRVCDRYTSVHDFRRDCVSEYGLFCPVDSRVNELDYCSCVNNLCDGRNEIAKKYDSYSVCCLCGKNDNVKHLYDDVIASMCAGVSLTPKLSYCDNMFGYISYMFSIYEEYYSCMYENIVQKHSVNDYKNIIFDNYLSGGCICVCAYRELLNNICLEYGFMYKKSLSLFDIIYKIDYIYNHHIPGYILDKICLSIKGVLFSIPSDNCDSVSVRKIIYSDKLAVFRLLDEVKNCFPDRSIEFYHAPGEFQRAYVKDQFYVEDKVEDGVGTDLESVGMCQQSSGQSSPYGMLRLTNMLTLLDFIAGRPGVGKLSILVTLSESAYDVILLKFGEKLHDTGVVGVQYDVNYLPDATDCNLFKSERKDVEMEDRGGSVLSDGEEDKRRLVFIVEDGRVWVSRFLVSDNDDVKNLYYHSGIAVKTLCANRLSENMKVHKIKYNDMVIVSETELMTWLFGLCPQTGVLNRIVNLPSFYPEMYLLLD